MGHCQNSVYGRKSIPCFSYLTYILNHRVMVILTMITKNNSLLFSQWGSELCSGEVLCDGEKSQVFLFHHLFGFSGYITMRQK